MPFAVSNGRYGGCVGSQHGNTLVTGKPDSLLGHLALTPRQCIGESITEEMEQTEMKEETRVGWQ